MRALYTYDFKVDYFTLDIFGNRYVVHESELVKSIDTAKSTITFSNLSLGEISSVDASDAMNILVFYQDFAKVLFLDNTLSLKKSAIDLGDLGFPNASLACLSYNNGFWIFDPVNQELIRINQFLEVSERSGNLNQIINTEIEPDQLFESGNNVYLKDKNEGVFIFDRYAGYQKRMPFTDVDDVQIIGSNVMTFLKNDTVFSYDMLTLNTDTIPMRTNGIKQIFIKKNNVILYLEENGNLYFRDIQSLRRPVLQY
jgi:hypothetical protein